MQNSVNGTLSFGGHIEARIRTRGNQSINFNLNSHKRYCYSVRKRRDLRVCYFPSVRKRGSNAWLQSARISRHWCVDLSDHACQKRQLRTFPPSPTPSKAMHSIINDRSSIIQWPFCAVNSSWNGFHFHSKRDLWHEVRLEKNLEQPNIDSFLRLGIVTPKPAILAQSLQANSCSN